jgi:uncharacterized phage protein gp47/JayE
VAELLDIMPLFNETEASVRARMNADLNAGLEVDEEPEDTRPGSPYHILTQPFVSEKARQWDAISVEVPASGHLDFAWSDYLDYFGEMLDRPRNPAAAAVGEVRFSGDEGTLLPSNIVVTTEQTDPDIDPISFRTTGSATITGGTATVPIEAVNTGSAGNVSANAIVVINAGPVGATAVVNDDPTGSGVDPETDEAYRKRLKLEYRGRGGGNANDYRRWTLDIEGVGRVYVGYHAFGAGTVQIVIMDEDGGALPDTKVDEVQEDLDPPAASTLINDAGGFTLPAGTVTVDSTTDFKDEGIIHVPSTTGRQSLTYTGKTATTLTGVTGGTGDVADDAMVTQQGAGEGTAPIGHAVLVQTPTEVPIDVQATVTHKSGYSLDGTAGTVATRDAIDAAIRDYIGSLDVGEDVILNAVESRFFDVTGVLNVASVQIRKNAVAFAAADIAIDGVASPPEIASPDAIGANLT